jgi:riboflavin kinase/FMN adenylyltransferase
MRRFLSLDQVKAAEIHRPVVTLGVFDGVHVGHRYVLDQVTRLARERQGESVVVTFREHPRAIIDGRPPQLITSLPHRVRLFEHLGIDAAIVLDFDDALRNTSAEDFVRLVFCEALRAEVVLLGFNCRFGKNGLGDFKLLQKMAPAGRFEARQAGRITLEGKGVSSTEIRAAILRGDLEVAAQMLGRPVSILGTVIAGDGRGRQLGWPTANLDLHHEVRPPRGVYGCEVEVEGKRYPALCNVGVRPTFTKQPAAGDPNSWEVRDSTEHIEVHLLGFRGDLYGRDLEVLFLTRLRDERAFGGKDALLAQLAADKRAFEAFLNR